MIKIKFAAGIVATIMASGLCVAGPSPAQAAQGRCKINASGGLLGGTEGVLVGGRCVPVSAVGDGGGGPQPVYRSVGCAADGRVIVDGTLGSGSCGANMPHCKLLVDGGAPGQQPPVAYAYQRQDPGTTGWVTVGFWCPQSQVPTQVPNAATVRDQVLRLLPRVAIGTTGSPATLVNLQTVLWAATVARRSLGRVTIVGQPVWLRIALAHATWTFGDGTSEVTDDPGKAYDPDGDPCAQVMCPDYYGHVYRATGHVTISLRVSWQATYSLDGAHFVPVDPDPLTGPASTHPLLVRQARAILVPNPGGD
jgi:hypothetical protein